MSLGRLVFRWYAVASALFFIAALTAGWILLAKDEPTHVTWRAPWVFLVILVSVQFWCAPFLAILEGCGQVGQIHKFNLLQSVTTSGVLWLVILAKGELWAAVASAAGVLLWTLFVLLVRYRAFFSAFLAPPRTHTISWKTEVWPMQWRLALSGVVNYFSFAIMTPVMFYYQGAAVAGQTGMTLQIMAGIQSVCLTWLKVQVPNFGRLVAQRRFVELDRVWLKTLLLSSATFTVFSLAALGLFVALQQWHVKFVTRLLDLPLVAAFLLSGLLMTLSQSTSAYLRSFRTEPILVMSVTCSLLIGVLVITLGRQYGAAGAAWSYCGVTALSAAWGTRIWARCRTAWCR